MIDADFVIAQHNLQPPIEITCTDVNGDPVDLTDATIRFVMGRTAALPPSVSAPATIIDAKGAKARYAWQAGDTDGFWWYIGNFLVTFQDGEPLSFPNDSYISIFITPAIGG